MLERMYIPMNELLKDANVRIELEHIMKEYDENLTRYVHSPRSFAQYFSLINVDEKKTSLQTKIEKVLSEFDKQSPVSLEEFYPFLKEKEWEKTSSDISYFTMYAAMEEDLLYPVSAIKVKWDENLSKYLFFLTNRDTLDVLCYQTKEKGDILFAMKKALLEGIVPIEKFTLKQ